MGGADPAKVLASLGKRVEFIHIKDGPAKGMDDFMVPYGTGVIDVPSVVRANPAVKWNIVEMDRSHYDMFWLLRNCSMRCPRCNTVVRKKKDGRMRVHNDGNRECKASVANRG